MTHGKPVIGYVRKSPVGKRKSFGTGLSKEAQEEALRVLAGGNASCVVATYYETETGTGDGADRPELLRALAHARRAGSMLVIARLDRLSRNMAFVATVMESGVEFLCCDNPHANRLTLHILAAVAEDEARRTSERTKDALAAYRRNKMVSKRIREMHPDGVPQEIVDATAGKLGASLPECRNLTPEARRRGARAAGVNTAMAADRAYGDLRESLAKMRAEGLTAVAMAGRLNAAGQTTRRGCKWSATQVIRVLERLGL